MKEVVTRLKAHHVTGNVKNDTAKIFEVIHDMIIETKSIRFEGNGYSEEWVTEAAKRGLPNLRKSPEAMKELISPVSLKALTEHGVLSEEEVHCFNVRLERYIKNMQIEVDCLKNQSPTLKFCQPVSSITEL